MHSYLKVKIKFYASAWSIFLYNIQILKSSFSLLYKSKIVKFKCELLNIYIHIKPT